MFENIIAEHARSRPDTPAIVDRRNVLTYRQMADDIARACEWLKTRGIGSGARIVLHVPSTYRHWVLFFAVEALGSVSIAVNPGGPIRKMQLDFLAADRFITSVRPEEDLGVPGVILEGAWLKSLRPLPLKPMPTPSRSSEDEICVVLSSGTTGAAKKVMLTRAMIDLRVIEQRTSDLLVDGARVLQMLPNSSIGGLVSTLSVWAVGATLGVYSPDKRVLDRLASQRPTVIAGAPTHLDEIIQQLPDDFVADPPIHASTGGGALPAGLAEGIARKLRGRIAMTYGSTEMGYVARGDYDATQAAEGGVGSVLGHAEVEIRDENQDAVPRGELGQVWVRGRHVVDGFLDDPVQTASLFRDGWFHPGDLGVLEADGRLFIKGRTDDLLNFRGLKMLAPRIEQNILTIKGVKEAAVFMAAGAYDAEPLVWIVYSADRPIDPKQMAPAMERGVQFRAIMVEAIPRNAMGKIDRALLRKRVQAIRPVSPIPHRGGPRAEAGRSAAL